MNDPTATSVIVTLSVAVLAFVAGIVNEHYKRHRDAVSTSAILHADISALKRMTLAFETVQNWEHLLTILESRQDIKIPDIYSPEPSQGSIFNANVEKLGLLRPEDAADVILFYDCMLGIRYLLKSLGAGIWDQHPDPAAIKAVQIRTGLRFWSLASQIADRLLPSLAHTAAKPFLWPSPARQSGPNAVAPSS